MSKFQLCHPQSRLLSKLKNTHAVNSHHVPEESMLIRRMRDNDVSEAADVVANCFVKYNSPTAHLKITKEEMSKYLTDMFYIVVKENISSVAVSPITGAIVGASIFHDEFTDLSTVYRTPKLALMEELYSHIDKIGRQECNQNKVKASYVSFCACHPQFFKKGLAIELGKHSLELSKRFGGHEISYYHVTNPTAIPLLVNSSVNGYTLSASIPFNSFQASDGSYPFASLSGGGYYGCTKLHGPIPFTDTINL